MKLLISIILLSLFTTISYSTTYYIHAKLGHDSNDGLCASSPFQTLSKANSLNLKAGDKILLASGCTYYGALKLNGVSGGKDNPILVASYQEQEDTSLISKPTIDAKGFLNGILLENCSHIVIKDIEITANGTVAKTGFAKEKSMRCGILVQATEQGNYKDIKLQNLLVRDVFYEEPGFTRGKGEVKTANGTQSYGWGIRYISKNKESVMSDLVVENCEIKNVSHTGIKWTGSRNNIQNIKALNNKVSYTGGPGMQMSGVVDALIKGNDINYSGSNDDTRKWGRGSGFWTWNCDRVLIEHNSFKNANGPGDSAGCHIDYNCNNVIVQYNLSVNNAGGFCEILGNNYNCAYRYNVSVNDGHRVKGKNGAFQEGKIFWLSGYAGNKKPRTGPFNSYFYNNTIYVSKDIVSKIAVNKDSKGVLIANNIFCIEGESKAVLGDQYKPEKNGQSTIQNIMFKNNLYLSSENWPLEVLIQDEKPLYGKPAFVSKGKHEIAAYTPNNKKLIKNKGIEIENIPRDTIGLFTGLEMKKDILGNKIKGKPDLGAIEIK